MYYKVIYNGQVIDTLDHLSFVKYQAKHGIMVNCTADDAEGIVSRVHGMAAVRNLSALRQPVLAQQV